MRKEAEQFIKKSLKSWEFCKSKVLICASPKNSINNGLTFSYLDLDIYVRIIIFYKGSEFFVSCVVNEGMLKQWNIDCAELFDAAMENSIKQYSIETLSELLGIQSPVEQVVVRLGDEMHGAGAIVFTDTILNDVANFFDSDVIIIPSSIHEILCMSANDIDLNSASQLVREVNEETVEGRDRLSDHAYLYHRKSKVITW